MIIKQNRGSILLVTLIVMSLMIVWVGMVMTQTSTVAKNTKRSTNFQGAQAAAMGAVDYAYAVWLRKTAANHSLLRSSDLSLASVPSFPGYEYVSGAGSDDGTLKIQALDKWGCVITSTNTQPDVIYGPVTGYDGWWGRTYTYAATARMRAAGDPGAPVAGVRRLFHYTEVPIFQCMFFFEHDLEIYNPANMIIKGRIHSNQTLYLSTKTASSNLTIMGSSTYVNNYSFTEPPTVTSTPAEASGTDYAPLGKDNKILTTPQLQKVSPMSPMGSDLDTLFSGTGSSANPNLSGSYHELIEVPVPSSPDPIESDPENPRRLFNIAAKSGLIVRVTGTSITAATAATTAAVNASSIAITTIDSSTGQPKAVAGKTVLIAAGNGISLPTTPGTTEYNNAVYAFSQSLSKQQYNSTGTKFYDSRENAFVNVVNVDVGLFNTAVANSLTSTSLTNYNDVVYIYDDSTSTNTNSIRLKNGATLNDDLTIASPNPVYVQGDYNTGGTGTLKTDVNANGGNANNDQQNYKTGYELKTAAIISDALTLLSNNWTDSKSYSGSSGTTVSNRPAKNTTYNVALLGGYLQSDSVSSSYYSGGAINYPRFLEGWSGIYCTYFGSMVELFPSKSQKPWIMPGKTGEHYSAPNRRFNFDERFLTSSPPGSTNAVVLTRGLWSKW